MVEIQEESNGRLLPMALMPWWDVEASIAEVQRTAADGLRGVNLCSDPQSRGAPELWQAGVGAVLGRVRGARACR